MILSSLWLEMDAGVFDLSSVKFTAKPPCRYSSRESRQAVDLSNGRFWA